MTIPNGYTIKARFCLRGRNLLLMHIIGLLLALLLLLVFVNLTKTIHSGFSLMKFLAKFDSPAMLAILGMALVCFLYIHAFVHEKIHQTCYRIFGQPAEMHMNFLTPNVTLPIGDGCIRNKAIIAALGPLVILGIFGLLIWFVIANDFLFLVILFLSTNLGLAAGDLIESVWLVRHPSNYYFGFDGQDSVLYGP